MLKSFRERRKRVPCAVRLARPSRGRKMARNFGSLSHQTVARRDSEMNEQISTKLKFLLKRCKYFYLWTKA